MVTFPYSLDRSVAPASLFAGTLTDPAHLSPSLHTHADEQLPWFEMLDDLPRYAQGSRGQTPMRYGARGAEVRRRAPGAVSGHT
jgi:hypothetical protein